MIEYVYTKIIYETTFLPKVCSICRYEKDVYELLCNSSTRDKGLSLRDRTRYKFSYYSYEDSEWIPSNTNYIDKDEIVISEDEVKRIIIEQELEK